MERPKKSVKRKIKIGFKKSLNKSDPHTGLDDIQIRFSHNENEAKESDKWTRSAVCMKKDKKR